MPQREVSSFEIPAAGDAVIRGDVHHPRVESEKPLLIFCHGFKGFKDWGFFPFFGERLSAAGYPVLRFNFSLNGVGEDLLHFTELEKFKENTFSREREDLDRVIAAGQERKLPVRNDFEKLVLVGHSRGGFAALSRAADDGSVRRLISLASIADTGKPSPDREEKWRKEGVRYITNSRTNQEMPLGLGLLEDMYQLEGEMERLARRLAIPHLIIHGTNDSAVSHESAEKLASWSVQSELHLIEGADHVFGARHPFQGSTEHLDQVVDLIEDFLSKILS